ncbi:MAG: AgmX/PglI C-terminal domain-containing protein, partial [Myxococcota bacterium]|nr:AgmX/PglI C-terminal domain-containing protein [Myxococcota bacterium]
RRAPRSGAIAIGGQESRGLTGNQILPVVQEGQAGIQLCYNQARTRDFVQDLSMRMTIEINPDGSVRNVTLATEDYVSGELHDCLTSRVSRWRFPRAMAASRVVLPFAFHQR